MIATAMERVFYFTSADGEEIRLADPNGRFTKEEVLNFYSATYPILTTATIQGPELKDDEMQFRFVSTLGTKG